MSSFEDQYIRARKKEQRLYEDDEVSALPDIDPSHIHSREWKYRKRSFTRLCSYLRKKGKKLNILEVGCGNGWLAANLSMIPGFTVTGIDINIIELSQARRVFGSNPRLKFICGDIRNDLLTGSSFDLIIFAASIQYFQSLSSTINLAASLLNKDGELHILDTHFYTGNNLDAARVRTEDYYIRNGVPQMAEYYFHHSIDEIKNFDHRILAGNNVFTKLVGIDTGLKWICIKP